MQDRETSWYRNVEAKLVESALLAFVLEAFQHGFLNVQKGQLTVISHIFWLNMITLRASQSMFCPFSAWWKLLTNRYDELKTPSIWRTSCHTKFKLSHFLKAFLPVQNHPQGIHYSDIHMASLHFANESHNGWEPILWWNTGDFKLSCFKILGCT